MLLRVIALSLVAAAIAAPVGGTARTSPTATCSGAISWSSAKAALGQMATIKGRVVDTYYARTSTGGPTFLNLGRAYPNPARFTIVIWERNRGRFGVPERRYRGRTICVRGRVSSYRGVPQIEAVSPSQIALAG